MLHDEELRGEHILAELMTRHSHEEVARALIVVMGVKNERYKDVAKELLVLQCMVWDSNRH